MIFHVLDDRMHILTLYIRAHSPQIPRIVRPSIQNLAMKYILYVIGAQVRFFIRRRIVGRKGTQLKPPTTSGTNGSRVISLS